MYSVSFIPLTVNESVDFLCIVTITMTVNIVDCLPIKHTFNKTLCLVKEC